MRVWYYDKPRTQFLFTRGSIPRVYLCAFGENVGGGESAAAENCKKEKKNTKRHRERKKQLSRSF